MQSVRLVHIFEPRVYSSYYMHYIHYKSVCYQRAHNYFINLMTPQEPGMCAQCGRYDAQSPPTDPFYLPFAAIFTQYIFLLS